MNGYEMLELLRDNVGEREEAHYTDKLLLRRLNAEHREVARLILDSPGDWLVKKSSALTPVASVITPPSDMVRPVYIEEVGSGRVIRVKDTVRERQMSRMPGAGLAMGSIDAYMLGPNIEVNAEGYGEQVYLWYEPRIIDFHAGLCGDGTGATTIVFDGGNWPSGVDDYYNDIVVEVRDQSNHVLNVKQAITDYVGATFTATIASSAVTAVLGDFYGTLSDVPEELHNLIVLRATVRALAKPNSTFEKELFSFWRAELKTAKEEAEAFLATRISGSVYTRIVE